MVEKIIEDCVAQSHEGDQEYTKLEQIRICNHGNPSFLSSGGVSPSLVRRVSRLCSLTFLIKIVSYILLFDNHYLNPIQLHSMK